MPAGRADRPACGDDARSRNIAALDRLLEPDILEIGRADVAHRGEARVERRLRIGDADDGPEAVGVAKRLIAADLGERGQVDMHVDESGKQGPLAEVDMPDVGAPAHRARVGDVRDPPVGADEDRRIIDRLTAYDVEHRSEEHTSELQSLMRISYAVFCLKKKKQTNQSH